MYILATNKKTKEKTVFCSCADAELASLVVEAERKKTNLFEFELVDDTTGSVYRTEGDHPVWKLR